MVGTLVVGWLKALGCSSGRIKTSGVNKNKIISIESIKTLLV